MWVRSPPWTYVVRHCSPPAAAKISAGVRPRPSYSYSVWAPTSPLRTISSSSEAAPAALYVALTFATLPVGL